MGYSTKSCRFAPSRTTYVSVGNYHAFERTDSFSVSVWAKWTATGPTNYTMIGKMSDPTLYRGWAMRANATGEVQVYLINDNSTTNQISVQTTAKYNDGVWHHVTFTYDGSSTAAGVKIYVDGALQAKTTNTDALSGTIVSTDELRLGARKTTGNETYFNGNLDEAAVYNKTLSAAEVSAIWNLGTPNDLSLLGSATNLVGWWRMGDGDTYPTLTDHGSGAHDGTMTSMLSTDIRTDAPPTMRVVDYSTKSCLFRGAQYATLGDVLNFERTDAFSISFWAKWSGTTTTNVFIGKNGESTALAGYTINTTSTGKVEFYLNSDYGAVNYLGMQTNSTFNNGVWHHICVTYAGTSLVSGVVIYVDNVAQATTTLSNTLSTSILTTAELYLGARATTSNHYYLTGFMDEVSVYNKALSAAEVGLIYNSGGTNDLLLLVGSDPNLVGWWRMGDGDTYPTLTDRSTGAHNATMTDMIAADIHTDAPFPRLMALDHTNWRFKANLIQPYTRLSTAFTAASNQYVTLGNVLAFERTDSFSWSFWMKAGASASSGFVVAKAISGTPEGYQIILTSSGNIVFGLTRVWTTNCISVNTTGAGLRNSVWRHIVVTYDGSSTAAGCKIYVDGALGTLATAYDNLTGSIVSAATLRFGTRELGYPAECFGGNLDEISVYNSVLSLAQVQALYNGKCPTNLLTMVSPSPTNLIGWWRMGDGDTSPTITDNSTGGHNGTMVNTPTFASDWPVSTDYIEAHKTLLRNIKDNLKSSTGWTDSAGAAKTLSTPWTVVASSNGTVADTSDNWNTNADMVFTTPGTAHSWIVLRQTGISGQNYEVCLDCKSTNQYLISAYISYAGFNVSSLVTTRRPVATDEQAAFDDTSWFNGTATFSAVLNFAVTDDGQCTRWWGLIGGASKGFWLFDRPKNAVAGWTNPAMYCMQAPGPLYTYVNDNAWTGARINGVNTFVYLSSEFYNGMAVGQAQTAVNSISSEYPINRVGIACIQTRSYGRQGEISDLWWTSTTPVVGDTFPATGTLKQFVVIPNMVHPWNRSTPVTT